MRSSKLQIAGDQVEARIAQLERAGTGVLRYGAWLSRWARRCGGCRS